MVRHGPAFGHLLGAADMAIHGAVEVAIAGRLDAADTRALLETIASRYVPALALAGGEPNQTDGVALLADRPMRDGRATAYLCRGYVCQAPTTDPERLAEQIEDAVRAVTPQPA